MGEVWHATHRMLARPAAIKLIKPEMLGARRRRGNGAWSQRFRREAEAASGLQSPHTIRLYDFGETRAGTFYFVMELLEGLDLETLVRRYGPLPPARVVYLLRQACHSLGEAHERGLIHRDVKPANIYLCRLGREYDFVKVLDFGLVKYDQDESTARHHEGRGRSDDGNARLHGAGDGERRAGGPARRPVCAGLRGVLAADG